MIIDSCDIVFSNLDPSTPVLGHAGLKLHNPQGDSPQVNPKPPGLSSVSEEYQDLGEVFGKDLAFSLPPYHHRPATWGTIFY